MAEHLLGHPGIRIGVLAEGEQLFSAEETLPTGNWKRRDAPIADADIPCLASHLDHFAHEFMAEHVPLLHRRHEAVVEVQIRATNGRRGDLNDGITPVE